MPSLSLFLSQVRPSFRPAARATFLSLSNQAAHHGGFRHETRLGALAEGVRIEAPARTDVELQVAVPGIEALVEQARRWTKSCVLVEQLDTCAKFFQKMAVRGLMHGKYSSIDVEKLGSLVEFMIASRAAEIGRNVG